MTRRTARWLAAALLVLAFILLPFAAFAGGVERWTGEFLSGRPHPLLLAAVLAGLLAADIALPVPSSLVSTAAGYTLGFVGGALTSFLGMTAACVTGYWLGATPGRASVGRLLNPGQMEVLARHGERFGVWALAVVRPIPVLAEASVLLAGMARMHRGRFLVVVSLSNLGISVVYAAAGALSGSAESFLAAVAAAVGVPLVTQALLRSSRRASLAGPVD